jgi:hypothetical protein
MKAKQIHLDEKVIEILTIKAVKEKTTFKELVQKILTDKAKEDEPSMLEALIHIEDYVTRSLTLSGHSEKEIDFILRKVRPSIKKATSYEN